MTPYTGRFAPSPTGPLHAGSLVAALASWLDARANGGQWLVRIEDVDTPRCVPGADALILYQLACVGLVPDAAPLWQSRREAAYRAARDTLIRSRRAYACVCSRKAIEAALAQRGITRQRGAELVYPGTCRAAPPLLRPEHPRAWRLWSKIFQQKAARAHDDIASSAINSEANEDGYTRWRDRRLGAQAQDVEHAVGDFVLQRADGLWSYQLAVVVDDAAQGITHVVRGEDLADNTPRQIVLQRALGLPTPMYLHTPLVLGANGEKLSKQNGAQALDLADPQAALARAAARLELPPPESGASLGEALGVWVNAWRERWP